MCDETKLPLSILVVDDEALVLSTMSEYLSERGAAVSRAANGLDALELLRSHPVDIVLTDRNMPGLNGQELLQEIRSQWPDIDVVMMTGVSSVKNAVEAMRLGAADYIEKPVDLPATLSILKRVGEHRRIRLERDRLRAELALRELGQVITANLHMADLPSRIADLITRVFEAREIAIQYRFSGETEEQVFWRSSGPAGPGELTDGEQLMIIEAASSGRVVQKNLSGSRRACVPLAVEGKIRGSILIAREPEKGEFGEAQVELLMIMATQVNVALENAFLYQAATRQMRFTQKLAEIGRRLNKSLQMEPTLKEIHSGIRQFVDCDYSVVVYLDRSVDCLQMDLRGSRRPSMSLLQSLQEHVNERVSQVKEQDFSWTSRTVNTEFEQPFRQSAPQQLRHLSWVPVTDSQGIYGLLGLVRLSGDEFSAAEVQSFMLLSSSISSALQNSLLFTSMRRLHFETVQVLSKSIDEKDHYTHGHSAQVGEISVKLARRLGIQGEEELVELRLGALMHDLGKIGIRDAVLNKPGKLDTEEYAHIQTHPLIGSKILERAPHLHRLIPYVRHHHERWDGRGYPDGLSGERIPLAVRALTLADTFHALASDRIYRRGMPVERILDFLREESGKMFDPQVVRAFLDLWNSGIINRHDVNYEPVAVAEGG